MVSIRFTKMEVQELRLWASAYRDTQEGTGIAWEHDQQKIREKLDKAAEKRLSLLKQTDKEGSK
ncbi:hypothetical protein GOV13_02660 [Candidatus Pacearchaeota archaeon]|nr:hypothetical protein [Candidatus Pacearchaeota archaeon]